MRWRVEQGDCRDIMRGMPDASMDAIVSDPPYGLSFMGKGWDHAVPGVEFWTEALRVAKPGAHLVAFGGTRTFHRLAVAIEDAGWEIRDCLSWNFGSGFPKSHNGPWGGTALKPAWEPIILARKPLAGTVAANVAQYGTGSINVDGCRIGTEIVRSSGNTGMDARRYAHGTRPADYSASQPPSEHTGRWPANVVLDEDAAAMLDAQTGERSSPQPRVIRRGATTGRSIGGNAYGEAGPHESVIGYGDSGGASRFFYCAKASRREREAGLEGMPVRLNLDLTSGDRTREDERAGTNRNGPLRAANHHPTVKPIALMRWLCRLVTPPGGLVFDPFAGSGTTGCAAVLEGFDFVGAELSEEYADIARRRIAHWAEQVNPQEALPL
jgi:DNA modification methylase